MKKLFAIILAVIALAASAAPQTVPIVWPFAVGAQQANYIRAIVEEANKQQDKYNFIFENKPGAGGTVAARYVNGYQSLAILSSSSSFFVRPQFYPNESYRNEDFKPVLIECLAQPYAIVSGKYSSVEELRKQKSLTIGLIQGSLTEAMGRQLQSMLPNTELVFVGYQGTHQPTLEMLAGNLDLNVDLPAYATQWIEDGKLKLIGASGTKDYKNFKTFHSQGVKGFEGLVSNYQMVVRADTDPAVAEELHAILRKAANASPGLPRLYADDYCSQADMNFKQTNDIYARWLKYWPEKLQSLKK